MTLPVNRIICPCLDICRAVAPRRRLSRLPVRVSAFVRGAHPRSFGERHVSKRAAELANHVRMEEELREHKKAEARAKRPTKGMLGRVADLARGGEGYGQRGLEKAALACANA